jgi:hypothetical protein
MRSGSRQEVLQYVKNTNGGATKADFIEDHEPIGHRLWQAYCEQVQYIAVDPSGRIYLTPAGAYALQFFTPATLTLNNSQRASLLAVARSSQEESRVPVIAFTGSDYGSVACKHEREPEPESFRSGGGGDFGGGGTSASWDAPTSSSSDSSSSSSSDSSSASSSDSSSSE